MLYDQIDNAIETEDLYGGGFSIFGASGEIRQLKRKKINVYNKLIYIIEQLKKDNDVGSISEEKNYFEVTTESYRFSLRDGIAIWLFHVFDKEQKILYKVFVYGSADNLISHSNVLTPSYGRSMMHTFYTLSSSILAEVFNDKMPFLKG